MLVFLRAPEQFIGVAHDSGPTEFPDAVDDLSGTWAHERKIAPVHHEVDAPAADVNNHGLQRGEVSVDVGNQRKTHTQVAAVWTAKRAGASRLSAKSARTSSKVGNSSACHDLRGGCSSRVGWARCWMRWARISVSRVHHDGVNESRR